MKKEEFVAHYVSASVGLTTTENAIKMAEAAWLDYRAWLAAWQQRNTTTVRKGNKP